MTPSVAAWAAAGASRNEGRTKTKEVDVLGLGGAGSGSGELAKFGDAELVALAGAQEENALGGDSGGREQPDGLDELAGEIGGGDERRGQALESRIGGEQLRRGSFVSVIDDEDDEQRGCDGRGSGLGNGDLHANLFITDGVAVRRDPHLLNTADVGATSVSLLVAN